MFKKFSTKNLAGLLKNKKFIEIFAQIHLFSPRISHTKNCYVSTQKLSNFKMKNNNEKLFFFDH